MTEYKGTVDSGTDHNFWERITVSTSTFPAEAQALFRFRGGPKDVIMTVEGSITVIYSLNGHDPHGELIPSSDRSQVIFTRRPMGKIFFRTTGGTGTVTVEAWASV